MGNDTVYFSGVRLVHTGCHFAVGILWWRHNERDGVSNHLRLDGFSQRFVRAQIKENIKAPRHWPLWGEFTSDQSIPSQKASNAEMFLFDDVILEYFKCVNGNWNISIWLKIYWILFVWGSIDKSSLVK